MDILRQAKKAKEDLDQIKFLLKTAQISYDEAKLRAVLPLQQLSAGMAVISKQHGFKPRSVSFASFMR